MVAMTRRVEQSEAKLRGGTSAKVDPTAITEAQYKQDIAPFEEGFNVLTREIVASLPRWTDALANPSSAKRAGLLLRTMRNAAGFSQARLGELAGMKQSDISDLENGAGKQGPTFDVVSRMADACGMYLTFEPKDARIGNAGRAAAVKAAVPHPRSCGDLVTVSAEEVKLMERAAKELAARHAGAAKGRTIRTFVMDSDGSLMEFESNSPNPKKNKRVILGASDGHVYEVKAGSPNDKIKIQEAKPAMAAAVMRAHAQHD
jgi:transcriptional regulator with XRE-family HTH domain